MLLKTRWGGGVEREKGISGNGAAAGLNLIPEIKTSAGFKGARWKNEGKVPLFKFSVGVPVVDGN